MNPTDTLLDSSKHCRLYGTLGCHLCEQAEQLLRAFVERGWIIESLDITDDAQWMESYALRIPVLQRMDNGHELDWPFDAEKLNRFLCD